MMNVRLLIQNGYRWSRIRDIIEPLTNEELTIGLNLLNQILRTINIDGVEIPIISSDTATLTAGTNTITLDDWIKLLTLQYLLGGVYVNVAVTDITHFRSASSIVTTSGIPYTAYIKRTPTGLTLFLFFNPDKDYTIRFDGYKLLTSVTLDTDLEDIELFIQDYLEFQLAYNLQNYYNTPISPNIVEQLDKYKSKFNNIKEIDISINTRRKSQDIISIYSSVGPTILSGGWKP